MKGIGDGGGKNMSSGENTMRVAGWFVVGEVIKELGTNVSACYGLASLDGLEKRRGIRGARR